MNDSELIKMCLLLLSFEVILVKLSLLFYAIIFLLIPYNNA